MVFTQGFAPDCKKQPEAPAHSAMAPLKPVSTQAWFILEVWFYLWLPVVPSNLVRKHSLDQQQWVSLANKQIKGNKV